jgi:hypothetical protein
MTNEPASDKSATDKSASDKSLIPSEWSWPSWWLAAAAALVFLAAFAAGTLIGVFVISSSNSGLPDDALACSYFWQFEAAPNIPMLAQLARNSDPGTGPGSDFLGQWLDTFYQEVKSAPTTATQLLSDSKNGTAVGISSICQQLGYNPPGGFVYNLPAA